MGLQRGRGRPQAQERALQDSNPWSRRCPTPWAALKWANKPLPAKPEGLEGKRRTQTSLREGAGSGLRGSLQGEGRGLKTIGLILPIRARDRGQSSHLIPLRVGGRGTHERWPGGAGRPRVPKARSPKCADCASAPDTPTRKPCGSRNARRGPRAVRWRAVLPPRRAATAALPCRGKRCGPCWGEGRTWTFRSGFELGAHLTLLRPWRPLSPSVPPSPLPKQGISVKTAPGGRAPLAAPAAARAFLGVESRSQKCPGGGGGILRRRQQWL